MLKKLMLGTAITVLAASLAYAQTPPAAPAAGGGGRGAGRGAAAAGGAPPQDPNTPTEEQWNKPEAQAFVTKARAEAGADPDLLYDFSYNCTAAGTHVLGGGGAVMTIGDGANEPGSKIPYVAMPAGGATLPPQRFFDNLWRFGSTGVGAWLVTTPKGYILFDTLNNPDEARDIILGGMKKVGLDPKMIKYVFFGHFHLDHTGGGKYIEDTLHPKMLMGRDDWPLYFKSMETARFADKTPMTRGLDIDDGMKLTIGDVTATFIAMPGHTPGSTGMIFNAKYQGKYHKVLVTTASAGGNNVRNRESFVGGFEHIWNWALKEKVESVINAHVNYNMNTLSRQAYVANNYPPKNNPMLYGVDKTRRYIEITRACSQARLAALGW